MNSIIQSLNLTEGSVLTLEKMPDRMEFEALIVMAEVESARGVCGIHDVCTICLDTADCTTRYINCHPYK